MKPPEKGIRAKRRIATFDQTYILKLLQAGLGGIQQDSANRGQQCFDRDDAETDGAIGEAVGHDEFAVVLEGAAGVDHVGDVAVAFAFVWL
jgi:hypothetical protein